MGCGAKRQQQKKLDRVGGGVNANRLVFTLRHDLDHAWPTFAYVIVAVVDGAPGALTSWRLRENRSAFDEESVAVEPRHGAAGAARRVPV